MSVIISDPIVTTIASVSYVTYFLTLTNDDVGYECSVIISTREEYGEDSILAYVTVLSVRIEEFVVYDESCITINVNVSLMDVVSELREYLIHNGFELDENTTFLYEENIIDV